jgi:hypothetical protein
MEPIGFRLRAWESWKSDHAAERAGTIPALLRRRITPLGRQALNAAWALPETANARFILSSRYGELWQSAGSYGCSGGTRKFLLWLVRSHGLLKR